MRTSIGPRRLAVIKPLYKNVHTKFLTRPLTGGDTAMRLQMLRDIDIRSNCQFRIFAKLLGIFLIVSGSASAQLPSPVVGPNVNMVAGTSWPNGDPFLQRQNEPSVAVSTRNPLHLLAGANDYRKV